MMTTTADGHALPPLPLAGEGWGGGASAREIAMAEEKEPTWKVSSKLRSNARALRKNSTDAERILWSELRDHRLNGASFRRQVPIGSYIADFMCHTAKLAIELDGGQHFSDRGEQTDAARSAVIEAKGFQVLRFSNHDVMTNRAGVLETITAAIEARAPTLTLPRKRRAVPGKFLRVVTSACSGGVFGNLSHSRLETANLSHLNHLSPFPGQPCRKRERGQAADGAM